MAHLYETGSMRRVHLKGRDNILKRLVVHAGGFNLALVMRKLVGVGKPRALQGASSAIFAQLMMLLRVTWSKLQTGLRIIAGDRGWMVTFLQAEALFNHLHSCSVGTPRVRKTPIFATGC